MSRKIKVGIYGKSIKGFVERAIRAGDPSGRFEFVDLNHSNELDARIAQGSLFAKVLKWLHIVKVVGSVDVLIVVYVDAHAEIIGKMAQKRGVKVIFYWLGSDVYEVLQGGNPGLARHPRAADLHLAYAENLVDELKSLGIDARLRVCPPEIPLESAQVPKEHAVLLSLPDARRDFYGYRDLVRLIREFPQVPFYVVRTERPDLYDEPNVVFTGNVSMKKMNELFDMVSISIRFPEHDGFSIISSEAEIKGKTVISKFPFPGAIHAKDYFELKQALAEVLRDPPRFNARGREHMLGIFDPVKNGESWVSDLRDVLGEIRGE